MSARMVLQRLYLLVACCALIISCASTPAPSKSKKKKKRGSDTELKESKRKKKKKKKKKVVVVEKEPEDDEDKDEDEDDDEDAPPKKPKTQREIKAERDRERKARLASERETRKDIDDENKRDAKRTASRDDEDDEDEDDEDDEDSGDSKKREAEKKAKAKKEAEAKAKAKAKAEREAKAEAAREAKAEAARKAKEEREAKAEAARKLKEERAAKAEAAREAKAEAARQAKAKQTKKRNVEDEDEDEDDEDADEEETPKTAAKAKAKPRDKAKSKSTKDDDDEDDEEDDSPPKAASKVAAKTKLTDKAKAKAKAPADEGVIDMTGAEPEAPPQAEADDEDREPAKEFDESSDDPLAEKRVAAIAVPGVDGEPGETDTGPAVAVAAQTGIHGRALTLGKGRFEAHGGLRVSTVTVRDPVAGTTTSTTSQGLALGATYGVSDKAQVGFDYTLGLSPGAIKGPFNLHGALSAKRSGNLEIAFAGALAFDFVDILNSTTMTTSSQTNAGLQLGFWMRYRATPKVSVFTGSPALPTTSPGLSKLALPLPPFAYQVAIGLNNAGTAAIEIPLGIGVAPIPNLFAFASINFAHVRIANTQSAFLFGDFVPLVLGGFYSLTKADIGLVFSDDLKQGTDYLRFDAMVRYSIQ